MKLRKHTDHLLAGMLITAALLIFAAAIVAAPHLMRDEMGVHNRGRQ